MDKLLSLKAPTQAAASLAQACSCPIRLDNASEMIEMVAPVPSLGMTALRKAVSARGERITPEVMACFTLSPESLTQRS